MTADERSPDDPGSQRLDKWLWFARVVKSRTLAAKLVTGGGCRINRERTDRPADQVKPGDVLTIAAHNRVRVLKVLLPGERRGPAAEAARLFEDLTPPVVAAAPIGYEKGSGRPTKRERRELDRLRDRSSHEEE